MKRQILFVDDETRVLDGLRRMLHSMRNEWDMTFAPGGAEALELLNQKDFDVVVTDMRMPYIDGAELLSRVKERQPRAVRIVLSGYAEQKMVMKAFVCAHQYLTKPADAQTLKSVIRRACALQDILLSEALQNMVSRTDTLPSAPAVYTRISELMNQSDTSVRQIGEVVATDLAMSAKILQVVNSAYFGLPRQFSDIVQAVVYLGSEVIRSLVLSYGLFSSSNTHIDADSLFQHSRHVSGIARQIAEIEKADKHMVEDVLIAGLLHDVGKLIIADRFPGEYDRIAQQIRSGGPLGHVLETRLLGTSHAQLGAYLMGLWGLSFTVMEAIAHHHQPGCCDDEALNAVTVVHAANALAHEMHDPDKDGAGHERLDHAHIEKRRLTDRMEVWRQAVWETHMEQ